MKTDTDRLDWMEKNPLSGAFTVSESQIHGRHWRRTFGPKDASNRFPTLRDAIDAAMGPDVEIYSIEPRRLVCPDPESPIQEIAPCPKSESEFWGVYETQEDGRQMHLQDFKEFQDGFSFLTECRDMFAATGQRRHEDVCSECSWTGPAVHFNNGICGGCRNCA